MVYGGGFKLDISPFRLKILTKKRLNCLIPIKYPFWDGKSTSKEYSHSNLFVNILRHRRPVQGFNLWKLKIKHIYLAFMKCRSYNSADYIGSFDRSYTSATFCTRCVYHRGFLSSHDWLTQFRNRCQKTCYQYEYNILNFHCMIQLFHNFIDISAQKIVYI